MFLFVNLSFFFPQLSLEMVLLWPCTCEAVKSKAAAAVNLNPDSIALVCTFDTHKKQMLCVSLVVKPVLHFFLRCHTFAQVLHSKKLPDDREYPEEGLRPMPALASGASGAHRFSAAALAQEQKEAEEAREREVRRCIQERLTMHLVNSSLSLC